MKRHFPLFIASYIIFIYIHVYLSSSCFMLSSCHLRTTPLIKRKWRLFIGVPELWSFFTMTSQSESDDISCWSNWDTTDVLEPQFCTWHDSFAVVACAKLWLKRIAIYRVRSKHDFMYSNFSPASKTFALIGMITRGSLLLLSGSILNQPQWFLKLRLKPALEKKYPRLIIVVFKQQFNLNMI